MNHRHEKVGYFGRKRNYRIIGTLVIIIGIILLIVGFYMVELGEKAKSRYETIGGGILRRFSPEDRENYEDAKDSIMIGNILEVVGVVISIIGLMILIKPELPNFIRRFNEILKKM